MRKFLGLTTLVVISATVMSGALAAGAGAASSAVGGGSPMIRATTTGTSNWGLPTISLNWSGYAATSADTVQLRVDRVRPADDLLQRHAGRVHVELGRP